MKKNYIQPKAKVHIFCANAFMDPGVNNSTPQEDNPANQFTKDQGGSSSMWENMDED